MAELLEALEEDEQKEFLEEMISPKLYTMFVTPKDVDETVRYLSFTIDVLTLGDKVKVICLGKDKMGRISFSMKDVPEEA